MAIFCKKKWIIICLIICNQISAMELSKSSLKLQFEVENQEPVIRTVSLMLLKKSKTLTNMIQDIDIFRESIAANISLSSYELLEAIGRNFDTLRQETKENQKKELFNFLSEIINKQEDKFAFLSELIRDTDFLDVRLFDEEDGQENILLHITYELFASIIEQFDDVIKALKLRTYFSEPIAQKIAHYIIAKDECKILQDLVKNGKESSFVGKLLHKGKEDRLYFSDFRFTLFCFFVGSCYVYDRLYYKAKQIIEEKKYLSHKIQYTLSPDGTHLAYLIFSDISQYTSKEGQSFTVYCLNIEKQHAVYLVFKHNRDTGIMFKGLTDKQDIFFDNNNILFIRDANGASLLSYNLENNDIIFAPKIKYSPERIKEKQFSFKDILKSLGLEKTSENEKNLYTSYISQKCNILIQNQDYSISFNTQSFQLFVTSGTDSYVIDLVPNDLRLFIYAFNDPNPSNIISYEEALYLRAAQLKNWDLSQFKEINILFKVSSPEVIRAYLLARIIDFPKAFVQKIEPTIINPTVYTAELDLLESDQSNISDILKAPETTWQRYAPTFLQKGVAAAGQQISAAQQKFKNLYNRYQTQIKIGAGAVAVSGLGIWYWKYGKGNK